MLVEDQLLKASELKSGMKLHGEEIISVHFYEADKKITVITTSGTILANGILTTTICGDYVDVHGNELGVLEKWKKDHDFLMQ
jgi:hypothetical protein